MSNSLSENHAYQVVARRYRPQVFADLVGQDHVAKALASAIQSNRIGHAYLFTGARGTGKTSSARIFAKSLNCVHGPIATPCNVCEICQGISSGEDIDVLEIDGASNRGIDEIRTIRQNVNIRPSRARFKIYIIDEVHMLTKEAFNALLKTLEEPPEHVKFIFCTTEAGKIPITILSRCQRFDFAGINTPEIARRLTEIVELEGMAAEPEAMMLLARRAAGSMRDGQSLLEQLLSFASEKITVRDVHQMLGTAGEDVLMDILGNLVARNLPEVLRSVDVLTQQGSDPGLILEQLFGYFRDGMALLCGCEADLLLFALAENEKRMREFADFLGMETILAAMQIADQTLARLKQSTQARLLVEMALVRIASLKDLEHLAEVLLELQKSRPAESRELARPAAREMEHVPEITEKRISQSPYVPTRTFSQEVQKTAEKDGSDTQDEADAKKNKKIEIDLKERNSENPDSPAKNVPENVGDSRKMTVAARGEMPPGNDFSGDVSPPDDVMAVLHGGSEEKRTENLDFSQRSPEKVSEKIEKTEVSVGAKDFHRDSEPAQASASAEKPAGAEPAEMYREGLKRLGGPHFENLRHFLKIESDEKNAEFRVFYPFTQSFSIRLLKKSEADYPRLLRELAAQAGHSVNLVFEVAEEKAETVRPEKDFRENTVSRQGDHPLIQAIEELFGGAVVHTEDISVSEKFS